MGLFRVRGAIAVGVERCWIRGHVCDAETRNGKGRDWSDLPIVMDGGEFERVGFA